jgi:O-antigen/teichoic acid export membrane protein
MDEALTASPPRGRAISLRSNASWAFAGAAATAGAQWTVAVILARLFGPRAIGVFALGSAIAAPILLVSQLALRHALVADASRRFAFGDYLSVRVTTSAIAFTVICATCWALGNRGEALLALCIIGLGRSFDSVNDIYFGRLQQDHAFARMTRVMVLQGVLMVVLATAAILLTHSVLWVCLGFAASFAVTLAVLSRSGGDTQALGASDDAPGVRARRLGQVALRSSPLAVSHGLSAANGNMPRYAIEHFAGGSSLGQYAAVDQLTSVMGLATSAVSSAALPQLAMLHATGDARGFRGVLLKLLGFNAAIGAAGVVGAAILGPMVVRLIYGPAFAAAGAVLPWLVGAYCLVLIANATGVAVTAQGRFNVPVPVNLLALAVSIPACFIGVARFGLLGAVLGVGAAALVQVVLFLWLLRGVLRPGRRQPFTILKP